MMAKGKTTAQTKKLRQKAIKMWSWDGNGDGKGDGKGDGNGDSDGDGNGDVNGNFSGSGNETLTDGSVNAISTPPPSNGNTKTVSAQAKLIGNVQQSSGEKRARLSDTMPCDGNFKQRHYQAAAKQGSSKTKQQSFWKWQRQQQKPQQQTAAQWWKNIDATINLRSDRWQWDINRNTKGQEQFHQHSASSRYHGRKQQRIDADGKLHCVPYPQQLPCSNGDGIGPHAVTGKFIIFLRSNNQYQKEQDSQFYA